MIWRGYVIVCDDGDFYRKKLKINFFLSLFLERLSHWSDKCFDITKEKNFFLSAVHETKPTQMFYIVSWRRWHITVGKLRFWYKRSRVVRMPSSFIIEILNKRVSRGVRPFQKFFWIKGYWPSSHVTFEIYDFSWLWKNLVF